MTSTRSEAGPWKRYGIAVTAALVGFAASYLTWPYQKTMPWVFFFAAIMVSAWFGGLGPSLLTTALLALAGRYFFIKPYGEFTYDRESLLQTLVFVGVSLFIGYLASARRRAERHEQAERRRFQATVMSIGDAVIATDAAGLVVFMNGVAERLTGWNMAEARGKQLEEVFVIVNESSREATPNPVDKVLDTGRTQTLRTHRVLIARDATERHIDDSAAPIKDDRGETTGVVLVFRDVTDRTEAEQERQRLTDRLASQARVFDTALSNAADFIYTFDLEGRFTYMNHALLSLLQKEPEDAIGKNFFELGYPEALARRLQNQIQEVIDSRGRVSDETPFTSAAGHPVLRVYFCTCPRAKRRGRGRRGLNPRYHGAKRSRTGDAAKGRTASEACRNRDPHQPGKRRQLRDRRCDRGSTKPDRGPSVGDERRSDAAPLAPVQRHLDRSGPSLPAQPLPRSTRPSSMARSRPRASPSG